MQKETSSQVQSHPLSGSVLFRQKCYVNGGWRDAGSGEMIAVTNPANGQELGTVPSFSREEVREAIAQAETAFASWSQTTAKERAVVLKRWAALMIEHKDELGLLMTLEQGKPLAESTGEVVYAASFLEWFAEEARRVNGDIIPSPMKDRRLMVLQQPVGVMAAITPWNFPSAMIARKVGPAIAAGCSCVVKPASETPFSALALAVLAEQAGLPAGVLNIVTGSSREIGAELTSNPAVRKLSFTGSTEVGKVLMKQCASTVKKTSMELGGNAPFIIFEDADLEQAVKGVVASKFRNSGQTCVCSNRVLVHRSVANTFLEQFTQAVDALNVGDGTKEGITQGPLINGEAVESMEAFIADATEKGAKVITGGKRHAAGEGFFEPTIVTDLSPDMRLSCEEIFGPIAPVFVFDTEEEAVKLANDTPYGLAAYFYSRDLSRIWRVSEGLEYGMVGVNEGLISTEVAPFGGVKESGIGREGAQVGIYEYLETKYVCLGGIT